MQIRRSKSQLRPCRLRSYRKTGSTTFLTLKNSWRHMRQIILLAFLSVFPAFLFAQSQRPAISSTPQTFKLPATPKTVAWGYYDAAAPPVLHIHSGDTVVFDTLLTNSPTVLERAGVPPEQVQHNLRDIYKHATNKGPGRHILNRPVYVEEAEPGDT